jgi:hypothetical protein
MKPDRFYLPALQRYHLCFVVFLTTIFVSVMFISVRLQGLGNLDKSFFQRNFLIGSFNRLRMKIGDRVFNNVLVGKDGWLQFTGDHNLDDYQNALNFSAAELRTVAATIQACHQYARERNMTFLIVVPPNKASIYPDKMPEQMQPVVDLSRIDQLNNYLRTHNIPEVVDLRPALREARQQQDVYYKLGTHWNEYGAYIAYDTIIHTLAKDYPDLEPYSAKFLRFRRNPAELLWRGDIDTARILQLNHLSLEPTLFFTRNLGEVYSTIDFPNANTTYSYHRVSWIPDSRLPSLLIYHDSFGDVGLNNFLGLSFSKVHYIHRNSAPAFLNWKTIEQFSPDIILFEIVERNLMGIQSEIAGCTKV